MNFARTAFHFSIILPITVSLIACGGVDDGNTGGTPDYSTPTGCIQDTWTQSITSANGYVESTFEFLENGTLIERSYVDNISLSDYLDGPDTDASFDIIILPGVGVNVGTFLNALGPFFSEGYFHTEGTWQVDNNTSVITITLPKTGFGHSVWSASGAKNDFRFTNTSSKETTSQYAYCEGNQLVLGAFKGDDSDIAGEWDNLKDLFTVADDRGSALYEYRENGEAYASDSYNMMLENDGYRLEKCSQYPEGRYKGSRSFWVIDDNAEDRVMGTGVTVPEMTGERYFTLLTEQFMYRYDAGRLTRFDIMTGSEETLVNTVDEPTKVLSTLIPGGFVAIEKYIGGTSYVTRVMDDGSAVVRQVLPMGDYKAPVTFNGDAVVANYDTGDVYFLKSGENALSPISFASESTSVAKTRVTAQSVEGELFISQLGTSVPYGIEYPRIFWKYSTVSGQFEKFTEFSHISNIYKIIPGKDGYDVYGANDNSRTFHFVHLNENNDYAVSSVQSLKNVSYTAGAVPSGSFDSQFYVSTAGRSSSVDNTFDYSEAGFYLVDGHLGTTTPLTALGSEYSELYKTDSGSVVIAMKRGDKFATVFDREANWTSREFEIEGFYAFSGAAVGEHYAFQNSTELSLGNGSLASLQNLGTAYNFARERAAFNTEFFSSGKHMGIQARQGRSNMELLLFNERTESFDFYDLNPVLNVASIPELFGRMGDKTVITGWDKANSCTSGPSKGVLQMGGGYLWLDSSTIPFRKTFVLNRS